MVSRDVSFEIWYKKKHLFYTIKDQKNVAALRRVVADLFKIQDVFQLAWKPVETWIKLDDKRKLSSCEFQPEGTKFSPPIQLFLLFPGQLEPDVEPLSQPPPIPEVMRNEEPQQE
ncbi:unnamed protein product, partial [Mesorhabditis belari]|uniref:Uncharacterized protein n=1 Tax=Mesorhabditis belari TaxID=2138241 RepID=A0AAF3F030_9BILA